MREVRSSMSVRVSVRLGAVLLLAWALSATLALMANRILLLEARELIAESFVVSRVAEELLNDDRKEEAIYKLSTVQRDIMQYATSRDVCHSSLRYAMQIPLNLEPFALDAAEAMMFESYRNGPHKPLGLATRFENFAYKRWSGSRDHWVDWGATMSVGGADEQKPDVHAKGAHGSGQGQTVINDKQAASP